ncbi:hypothetical protein [Actinomadura sp. 7K507]|uniref:hypothetical protein n=1 Tax=Actinomadura sp. 7K507 TaxID=2530365 RepID=UPI00140460DF|nr:hypothetical protein [Actinomadura sp. 7K507]
MLSVPVLSRRRSMAVLVVQECGGGWSYLWDAARRTSVGAVRVAAEQITEIGR